MDKKCRNREALKWKDETLRMCYFCGKVSISTLGNPEEPIKSLILDESNESRRFLRK